MAEQIIKHLIDDIDGSPAHVTRLFSIAGVDYTIDLNETHNQQFDTFLAPFIAAARKARPASRLSARETYARYGRRSDGRRKHNATIRAWAKARGIMVADKGKIPASVVEQFEAAEQKELLSRPEVIRETAEQYAETNPGPMGRSLIEHARASIGDHYKR